MKYRGFCKMTKIRCTIQLQKRYPQFKRAVDCNITELENVLDYFSPPDKRKGWWPHNPEPQDLEGEYKACYETLREINPNTNLSTAQYIRKALKNNEDGSSEAFQITKILAKYLAKNEVKEAN